MPGSFALWSLLEHDTVDNFSYRCLKLLEYSIKPNLFENEKLKGQKISKANMHSASRAEFLSSFFGRFKDTVIYF